MRAQPKILALLVTVYTTTAVADVPNLFEPKKKSSEAIVASVLFCIKAASKKQPAAPQRTLLKYCSCMTDSQRKQGLKNLERVVQQCARFAIQNAQRQAPQRSPLARNLRWASEFIVSGHMACEERAKRNGRSVSYRQAYCGCLTDSFRANHTTFPTNARRAWTKTDLRACRHYAAGQERQRHGR